MATSLKQTEAILNKSVSRIIKALDKHNKLAAQGVEIGLKKAGMFLLRESMKIVPVDTGALRASGPATTHAEGSGFDTKMIVGYGVHYAIYVHENLTARHKKGKTAKYLEIPARTHAKRLAQFVGDEVKKKTARANTKSARAAAKAAAPKKPKPAKKTKPKKPKKPKP